jgi:diguanylate cyclase
MGIVALSLSVYVNICIIFATLSASFFLLSRNEAFSFDASYSKRVIFGVVGGLITLSIQQPNGALPTGFPVFSFTGLPVILTIIIGGWVSGLISLAIGIISIDGDIYEKMVMGLVSLTLFPIKTWRSKSSRIPLFIVFIILLYNTITFHFMNKSPPDINAMIVYTLLECFCFLILYYALMAQKSYIKDNIKIKDFAMIDSVTNLNNRKRVDQEIVRLALKRNSFGVVLIDLDDFKLVNDRYGHLVGDQLLYEIADVFRGTTRAKDFVSRYGGEEFIMFIQNQDPAAVLLVCQRIRQAVSKTLFLGNSQQPF